MCTAITFQTNRFYFGRTLDHNEAYQEEVVVVPRRFPLSFLQTKCEHFAIIGMAHITDGFPLMYDGCNEKGLAMAGLNFVGNAHYCDPIPGKMNIPCYGLIPWILGQCSTVAQVRLLLKNVNITSERFRQDLPCAQLHWLIADREQAITVEACRDGLHIHENQVGVMTNNPPFDQQRFHLQKFMGLSPKQPKNQFAKDLDLQYYSNGMGAIGLPGDLSSQSRFVRAAFTKWNSQCEATEDSSVTQFFHILGSVNQTNGCCELINGGLERTVYTSCCNCDAGIYYYTTYTNRQITAVNMNHCNLEDRMLFRYPLIQNQQIHRQN